MHKQMNYHQTTFHVFWDYQQLFALLTFFPAYTQNLSNLIWGSGMIPKLKDFFPFFCTHFTVGS